MRIRFLILLLFIYYPSIFYAKDCSQEEVLSNYSKSVRYQEAYDLFKDKKFDKALSITILLIDEAKKSNNTQLEVYASFLTAELLFQNKSYERSLQNFLNVQNLNKTDYSIGFYTHLRIGSIYIKKEKFNKSIRFFKKAEELLKNDTCLEKKKSIYYALGTSYMLQEEYAKAEKYYLLELKEHLKSHDSRKTAISYSNLGNLHFEQYKDQEAEEYFTKALETLKIKDSSTIRVRQILLENLSSLYSETNRPKLAYDFLYDSNELKDSIWNRDKVWELAEIEKEFDIRQKQQEVDLLTTQNKLKSAQRNGLFISALILFTLLLTGIYFYKEKVKSAKIITEQKEDLDTLNATKDKLFSIVSHDLRSSVNALKSSNTRLTNTKVAKENKEISTLLNTNSNIVNGAYNLLDNLLNWALLQTKQSYFHIEQQRLYTIVEHVVYNYKGILEEKGITFKNTISKSDKVWADQESLKLVVRNLVDNAIKFSNYGDDIKVYSKETSLDFCDLIIEDSGIGISKETRLELEKYTSHLAKKEHEHIIGTGLGLQLCKSLIKKNFGKFSIESTLGKGTKMIVSLPKPA